MPTGIPHRLAIPRLAGRLVERPSLIRRLDTLAPLTVLQALPGSGKTTLVAQWARHRLTLDDEVAWLDTAETPDPVGTLAALTTVCIPSSRKVIVVDEADAVLDTESATHLCRALAGCGRLHIVLCTRVPHPVYHEAQRQQIPVQLLTMHDLNATAEELRALAEVWGHEVDEEALGVLFTDVAGWLAPMRAALDRAQPADDPNGFQAACTFVEDHVLPFLEGVVPLDTAMTLAVPDPIPELVAHALIAERPCTDTVLQAFERHGLLYRARQPGGDSVWRYPKLLRHVLAERLSTSQPDRFTSTHRTIAHALASDTNAVQHRDSIITHARAGQDWSTLSAMWTEHGLDLASGTNCESLAAYLDLPTDAIEDHPPLALAASVATALHSHHTPAVHAGLLRSYADAGWIRSGSPTSDPVNLDTLTITAQMIADRTGGRVFDALAKAHTHATAITTGATVSTTAAQAWFYLHWAMSAAQALRDSAFRLFEHCVRLARAAGATVIASAASAQLALIDALAGHGKTAGSHLDSQEIDDSVAPWLRDTVNVAKDITTSILQLDQLDHTAGQSLEQLGDGTNAIEEWAALAWAKTQHAIVFGDPLVALTQLQRAVKLRQDLLHPQSRDQHIVEQCFAELLIALGELNRADTYLSGAGKHSALAVPNARLALLAGDFIRARRLASTVVWDPTTDARDRIQLLMIKASAALEMHDPSARKLFVRAYSLACEAQTLLPYAKIPRRHLVGLLEASNVPLDPTLRARIEQTHDPYSRPAELVQLTRREQTVLEAMLHHETLADVATELTVSLNTVKKQSAAIYAKLGVHDRAAALLRADQLGLLASSSAHSTE